MAARSIPAARPLLRALLLLALLFGPALGWEHWDLSTRKLEVKVDRGREQALGAPVRLPPFGGTVRYGTRGNGSSRSRAGHTLIR